MRNGYALCERDGLDAIAAYLGGLQPEQVDVLRGRLCIGVHRDVEVTDAAGEHRPLVSQAFCSAPSGRLPEEFTTSPLRSIRVAGFASGVRSYYVGRRAERATRRIALVLLTQLGGGAFGNRDEWIHAAMRRALEMMSGFALDVRLVSYGTPSPAILQMAGDFA